MKLVFKECCKWYCKNEDRCRLPPEIYKKMPGHDYYHCSIGKKCPWYWFSVTGFLYNRSSDMVRLSITAILTLIFILVFRVITYVVFGK